MQEQSPAVTASNTDSGKVELSTAVTTLRTDSSTVEQTQVFTLEDFAVVENWHLVGLSVAEFEEYSNSKLGRPVPAQRIPNEELLTMGYKSWRHYVLEKYMAYWG
jgi:hypothetical protein